MDVAMDIASALNELAATTAEPTRKMPLRGRQYRPRYPRHDVHYADPGIYRRFTDDSFCILCL